MDNQLIIRRYKDQDLDKLFDMIGLAFSTPVLDKIYEEHVKAFWLSEYSKDRLIEYAQTSNMYVAEYQGEIVGSGGVSEDDNGAYIFGVFTNPNCQGKGIGLKMMAALEQDEICLRRKKICLTAALSASGFYKKLGYTFKYEVPEIVVDGILEVVYMEKEI